MCDSSDGVSSNTEKEVQWQQAISAFMQPPFFNDICICIVTTDLASGINNEERVLANKFLLAFFSLHLRELIFNGMYRIDGSSGGILRDIPTIELHLGTVANAAQAFRVILRYLYTGVLTFSTVHPFQVLQVSRICQIPMVEMQLAELAKHYLSIQLDESICFPRQQNTVLVNSNVSSSATRRYYEVMKKEMKEHSKTIADMRNDLSEIPNESSSTWQSDNVDRCNEFILPSSDKEGWCRNKKYIEQVANGYMCTVCRKVYGRYNSVSYHVTIYHRNPPIKCDEKGCPFRTREARYIHFHKYYRHHIPLPDNIDLGSRKCPFCRHVSKSPAMLEKHINRHVQDADRAASAAAAAGGTSSMHFSRFPPNISNFQCSKCSYRGRTSNNLEQHKLFVHSNEMFRRKKGAVAISATGEQKGSRTGKILMGDAVRTAEGIAEMETATAISSEAAATATAIQSEAMCLVTPKA